ncbi:MAG: hypothetical protein A2Y18_00110 [Clostridiales bacterium GWD2_32_19]|nr:MAG: hypothetical protein A2Y18_00110 [Clostridiales bacterium GWD2_32_19]
MNIGLGVVKVTDFDVETNIHNIENAIKEAKEKDIDLLCFGEAILNGFDGITWNLDEDLKKNAISQDSLVMSHMRNLAIKNKIAFGIGYYEKYANDIYDSYIVFDENGETLINYRRVSITWKPSRVYGTDYKEGLKIEAFKYKEKTFAVVICGDLWYKENQKTVNQLQIDYLLWPLYISYTVEDWKINATEQYTEKVKLGGKNTLIINSWDTKINMANGGAFYINADGKLLQELPMLNIGVLSIKI